jgi:hypothetical protein
MHLLVLFGCMVSTNITGALHLSTNSLIRYYKHYRCAAPGFFNFLFQKKQRQRREMFVAIAVCLGF